MEKNLLLSIAIPTYNRAKFLDELLNSIDIKGIEDFIEILIIDNASTDNTQEIVSKYNHLNVRYIRNEKNIGPDNNFKKCIKESKGKYVWLLGDDEILLPNSLQRIIKLLQKLKGIGLIYLRPCKFQVGSEINKDCFSKKSELNYMIYKDYNEFLAKVSIYITFISANIINKDLILSHINLEDLENNQFVHVNWNILSAVYGKVNIIVTTPLFAARILNTGNYELCRLFGSNLIKTINSLEKKHSLDLSKFKDHLSKKLLFSYLPANIVRARAGLYKVSVDYKYCVSLLFKNYSKYFYLWIFVVVALIIPKSLGVLIVDFVDKLRK